MRTADLQHIARMLCVSSLSVLSASAWFAQTAERQQLSFEYSFFSRTCGGEPVDPVCLFKKRRFGT